MRPLPGPQGTDDRTTQGPDESDSARSGASSMVGRIEHTVAAVVFDWDGTAVPDRGASAAPVRTRLEQLSRLGVHAAVISGTHLENIDSQLRARPDGPGQLWLALNRGSELYVVTPTGPELVLRRAETADTTRLLDEAASRLAAVLRSRGLAVEVVSSRLNRRKIDLIPEPAWADPPKSRIGELVTAVETHLRASGFASIAQVVQLSTQVAAECGVVDPRITSDAKHVEIGVTDKSDSMHDVMACLSQRGVAGELVLVVGDEFGDLGGTPGSDAKLLVPEARRAFAVSVGVEPAGVPAEVMHVGGGPEMFLRLLDEQLGRARALRVPRVCLDPRWTIIEPGLVLSRHRVTESTFTLTSGGVGLRGSVEEAPDFGQPLLVASGVYQGPAVGDGLLPGPDPIDVRLTPPVEHDERVLDLRTGVLYRHEGAGRETPLRSMRFGSVTDPGIIAMRLEASAGRLHLPRAPETTPPWAVTADGPGGIGTLTEQSSRSDHDVTTLQRIIAVDYRSRGDPSQARAARKLASASAKGFEAMLAEQRAAWAQRWNSVDVSIPDDPESELALRFTLFHLWGLCSADEEIAVGARGLTGSGYSGHVFWDADVFVLPALVTIDPASAEAMVRYRLNRLPAARERARSDGRQGARYPWESALSGEDVTPTEGWVGAERVPILTGTREEHITADVAWAVLRNAEWSRPLGILSPAERELLAETARYWTSRIATDGNSAHLEGVIGPDEYHELVDDNAFTNGMARWNLRTAARLARAKETELREWASLADRLVDGYDPTTRLYEQFRGYFGLEHLLVADFAAPPVAADVLLGQDRIAGSQVIKQPDALMLHVLIPEETEPGSLVPNLDFYAPRTAHGSSLSPASMALLLARAGRADAALDLLRSSLRIDLDDIGGTTFAGVHIGACGAAWQSLVLGFLGARVRAGTLFLEPSLPSRWTRLEVRFRCLGRDVVVKLDDDWLRIDASAPLVVRVPPASSFRVRAGDNIRCDVGGSP